MNSRTVLAALLIAVPVGFTLFFTGLSMVFEYPDILREPTDHVLRLFDEGGRPLIALWYGMMISAVMFIPMALLMKPFLLREDTPYMGLATQFGVVAGMMQLMGFARWIFVVPFLADQYLDPAATESTRAAVEITFQAFHRYAGVALGEHMGYLFTALWTILISAAMLKSEIFGRTLGIVGMLLGAGIMIGLLEPAGISIAGEINAMSYILWSIWLVSLGITLLRTKAEVRLPAALVTA